METINTKYLMLSLSTSTPNSVSSMRLTFSIDKPIREAANGDTIISRDFANVGGHPNLPVSTQKKP